MINVSVLVSALVVRHAEALMCEESPDIRNTAEMIIVDVIMMVHEVGAPHARRMLADMLSNEA